jgi:hypothetical protein
MLPYAESFLEQAAANQWFIRFYADLNDLTNVEIKQKHMDWFVSQGLQVTQVRTQEFNLPLTNFYHVNFASDQDVRLKAYSDQFENADGVSLQPDVYQLYEWSYTAWCENGLRESWHSHITDQT